MTPTIQLARTRQHHPHGVLFAVYAPFGDDPVLSRYPGALPRGVAQHPLLEHLLAVAAEGVHVAALIDLVDDCSQLVEIPALQPRRMRITPAWKLDLSAPCTLAGFLQRAHARFPCAHLVLALEGHGAGYLPELDASAIGAAGSSGGSGQQWIIDASGSRLREADGGSPVLPVGNPTPPLDSPEVGSARLPMSTWGIGEALRRARAAGVPAPLLIHFNNCFNLSLELMHTVAPHAGWATAYGHYNFFTAGQTYPEVFRALRAAGGMTVQALAQTFGHANHELLRAKGNHPTLGGVLRLSRMKGIAAALNALAVELSRALDASDAGWTGRRARIRQAIAAAQQLDADGDFLPEVPDGMTDLGSLAARLGQEFAAEPVGAAAQALQSRLAGVWLYGDRDRPWLDESRIWDFSDPRLGLNILLPDPGLQGMWDWRSPYYLADHLAGQAGGSAPPASGPQIGFLRHLGPGRRPPWPQFIVDYHRDLPFDGYQRLRRPFFPVFEADFRPKWPRPKEGGCETGT